MRPVSLGEIGWRNHASALWWLGMLYRRPRQFIAALHSQIPAKLPRILIGLKLLGHALPWMFLISMVGGLGVVVALDVPVAQEVPDTWISAWGAHLWAAARDVAQRIASGIALGIASGIASGIAGRIAAGIATGIAVAILVGTATGIAIGMALVIGLFRLYYQLVFWWLVWPRSLPKLYRLHPVSWDDLCSLPFPGLHRLLIALAEHSPQQGLPEIDRLISSYPSQRDSALKARTVLTAREVGLLADLTKLDEGAAKLPQGEKGYLAQTKQVGEWTQEISRLQVQLNTVTRPAFRKPTADLICEKIENFRHRVAGFHEPLASEFQKAALCWLDVARRQRDEIDAQLKYEPVAQVFRAGDPVDRNIEAFIPRHMVIGEVEQQIMLATGCPGIVLYGRRRLGKSSLLRNLESYLPASTLPIIVSLQNAEAFSSLAHLIALLASEIRDRLRMPPSSQQQPKDLPGLKRLLDEAHETSAAEPSRLIIALDEYENIDVKIGQGVFPEDLLAVIRESIQMHRRITWVFAGSHEIHELTHAPWTSYLVSARTIEMPLFSLKETSLLLTDPLQESPYWKQRNEKRPRYLSDRFWGGESNVERIHSEAGGWPHLVQLIAETVVDLVNAQSRREPVDPALIDEALERAVVRGDIVLRRLVKDECSDNREWNYLASFAHMETQALPEDRDLWARLRRRLLVVETDDHAQMRVPLMQRWLRERGV